MGTAVIGYVHPHLVHAAFMHSMLGLQRRTRTSIDGIKHVESGPNIARARNALVWQFLGTSRAPWLLQVDTDMVFAPDVLDRLIAAADPVNRPVMGALCHMQETIGGDPLPTVYELIEEEQPDGADGPPKVGFARYTVIPDDAPMKVGATGTGCLLVHRQVFERMAGDPRTTSAAWPWFKESQLNDRPIGEDYTFMLRLAMLGIPVHVDQTVQVGHMKSQMMGKVG